MRFGRDGPELDKLFFHLRKLKCPKVRGPMSHVTVNYASIIVYVYDDLSCHFWQTPSNQSCFMMSSVQFIQPISLHPIIPSRCWPFAFWWSFGLQLLTLFRRCSPTHDRHHFTYITGLQMDTCIYTHIYKYVRSFVISSVLEFQWLIVHLLLSKDLSLRVVQLYLILQFRGSKEKPTNHQTQISTHPYDPFTWHQCSLLPARSMTSWSFSQDMVTWASAAGRPGCGRPASIYSMMLRKMVAHTHLTAWTFAVRLGLGDLADKAAAFLYSLDLDSISIYMYMNMFVFWESYVLRSNGNLKGPSPWSTCDVHAGLPQRFGIYELHQRALSKSIVGVRLQMSHELTITNTDSHGSWCKAMGCNIQHKRLHKILHIHPELWQAQSLKETWACNNLLVYMGTVHVGEPWNAMHWFTPVSTAFIAGVSVHYWIVWFELLYLYIVIYICIYIYVFINPAYIHHAGKLTIYIYLFIYIYIYTGSKSINIKAITIPNF